NISSFKEKCIYRDILMTDAIELKSNTHAHANGMGTRYDVLRKAHKYGVDLSLPRDKRPETDRIFSDGRRDWTSNSPSDLHVAYDQTVKLIREPVDLYEIVKAALLRESEQGAIYVRLLSAALNNCQDDNNLISVFDGNMQALIQAAREANEETGLETFISV